MNLTVEIGDLQNSLVVWPSLVITQAEDERGHPAPAWRISLAWLLWDLALVVEVES